jgi:UDP-glucuronate decarboxylase
MDYMRQYGVDVRIARIFNTYGPRMAANDGRVVSNFVTQALAGNPITIYGAGDQTRSFCYFEDLIEGLVRLFFTEDIDVPVNLGNPEEITVMTLAREVIDLTKSDSRIVSVDLPQDDPKQRKPDVRRAKELLGWEPKTSRRIGLMKTIEYFSAVTT